MVGPKHVRTGGDEPAEVAAGLVSVTEFIRQCRQLEGERQHQGIVVRPAALAGCQRLLQHPPGGARVTGLPVQPRQQVRSTEHFRVIWAVRWTGRLDGVGE